MRVINKNGTIDIPYEGTALEVRFKLRSDDTCYWMITAYSYVYNSPHCDGYRTLGYYKTENEAKDDLYDLKISYSKGENFYVLSGESNIAGLGLKYSE